MTSYYTTEAIVMGGTNIREADKTIKFYTKDFGRINILARSIRLEKSKLRCHVNKYSHSRIVFIGARNGHILVDAFLLNALHDKEYSLNYIDEITVFLLNLISDSLYDKNMWELIGDIFITKKKFPKCKEDVFLLKKDILNILGMMPESDINNENDIRRILSVNHML